MAVTIQRIYFNDGSELTSSRSTDLHILRGQTSGALNASMLKATFTDPGLGAGTFSNWVSNMLIGYPGAYTVAFSVEMYGRQVGDDYICEDAAGTPLGIEVDTKTGEVTTTAGPATKINNFILTATFTEVATADKWTAELRVQLHDAVADQWLVPPELNLRQGWTGYKFGLYVRFDDDVYGNLLYFPGVTWSSTDPGGVSVDPVTGELENLGAAGNVTIQATLPATMGGGVAGGEVVPEGPLPATHPVELVPENQGPGVKDMSDRAKSIDILKKTVNVLLISDGLSDAGILPSFFDKYTQGVVRTLNGNGILQPFKILREDINYWRCFIESPEQGSTFRNEYYGFNTAPDTWECFDIKEPAKEFTDSTGAVVDWEIEQMIYYVGLPVLTDGARTEADLRTQWAATVKPDPNGKITGADPAFPLPAAGKTALIDQWKNLANRFLINEVNSNMGIAFGDRPTLNPWAPGRSPGFHPDRMDREKLNEFLNTLTYTEGGVDMNIGEIWTDESPTDYGFNYGNIVIMVDGSRYGGAKSFAPKKADAPHQTNTIVGSVRPDVSMMAYKDPATDRFEIDFRPQGLVLTNPVPLDRIAMFAHELSHGWGLGDEYGDITVDPTGSTIDDIRETANLHYEDEIFSGGVLVGDNVKWNWHRMEQVGILTDVPVEDAMTPGNFLVTLEDGHTTFVVGEDAFLRFRDGTTPIGKDPIISNPLKVEIVAGNQVTVKPAAGIDILALNSATPADPNGHTKFIAGSVLYTPAIASPAAAAQPGSDGFQRIMADNVRNALNGIPAGEGLNGNCIDERNVSKQKPTKLSAILPANKINGGIVGVYTGGSTYACKVYHPAGKCLMRQQTWNATSPTGRTMVVFERLCPACRYIIVERLNPNKHIELDEDYDSIYYPI